MSADASDAEYITYGYRMSNRDIESALLIVTFEDDSTLTYKNLYEDWLKIREYERFFAKELNTEVSSSEEDAAREAAFGLLQREIGSSGKCH